MKKNDITRDELWGGESDWNKIDLDPAMEMELLAYDELVASVSKKTICKECLIEDDKVYKKYYLDLENDITFTLTLLKYLIEYKKKRTCLHESSHNRRLIILNIPVNKWEDIEII